MNVNKRKKISDYGKIFKPRRAASIAPSRESLSQGYTTAQGMGSQPSKPLMSWAKASPPAQFQTIREYIVIDKTGSGSLDRHCSGNKLRA